MAAIDSDITQFQPDDLGVGTQRGGMQFLAQAQGGPLGQSAADVRSEQPGVAIRSYPLPCTNAVTTCPDTTQVRAR